MAGFLYFGAGLGMALIQVCSTQKKTEAPLTRKEFPWAVAMILLHEMPHWSFLFATIQMTMGVWLIMKEDHCHTHIHESITHNHAHLHDDKHHTHHHDVHTHERCSHCHKHTPDIHHCHSHTGINIQ